MVAVALVGFLLGGAEALRRRRAFALDMAARHGTAFDNVMISPEAMSDFGPFAKYADYHMEMEQKWREAARHPWLPFIPDQPTPK